MYDDPPDDRHFVNPHYRPKRTYRLGNENDTYMETGFSYHHVNREQGADTPVFGTHFRIAYSSLEKSLGVDLGEDTDPVAELRGIGEFPQYLAVTAGQRGLASGVLDRHGTLTTFAALGGHSGQCKQKCNGRKSGDKPTGHSSLPDLDEYPIVPHDGLKDKHPIRTAP